MPEEPRGTPIRPVVGCVIALVMFVGLPLLTWRLVHSIEGSATDAAEDFLLAMSRGDATAARMACEPASGVPVEAALRYEPGAWGTQWAYTVAPRDDKEAVVEVRLRGKDGRERQATIVVSKFVRWQVKRLQLEGRSSFGPAELPAGMAMPEIRDVDVRKSGGGDGWDVDVTYVVTALKSEARGDAKSASVTRAMILRAPDGGEPFRSETTTDVPENAAGVHPFSEHLQIRGAPGRYVLHVVVTDTRTLLSAEKDIDFSLP